MIGLVREDSDKFSLDNQSVLSNVIIVLEVSCGHYGILTADFT